MRGIEEWGDFSCGLYIPCIFMYIVENIFLGILGRKYFYSRFGYTGHEGPCMLYQLLLYPYDYTRRNAKLVM